MALETYSAGCRMERQDIEGCLDWLQSKGRSRSTIERYRRGLKLLYEFLPEDKAIGRGTLLDWRKSMQDAGYMGSTINSFVYAANNYLEYVDHRECQLTNPVEMKRTPRPELSRSEYLRLLTTARALGDEMAYLLVKTFACTGIYANELSHVTVENVTAGRFVTTAYNVKHPIRVPQCLRSELLGFAARRGIQSGPIFRAAHGAPPQRGWAVIRINRLAKEAEIPEERTNPTALQKLFFSTRAGIMSSLEILADQAMDRQLEQEELTVGWDT